LLLLLLLFQAAEGYLCAKSTADETDPEAAALIT
jgi:hypothetical protein